MYWAKIWFDDLGETNAMKLAAWSHEVMRIEYCGTNRYRLAGETSQSANASFIANALLTDRLKQINLTRTNLGGWDRCYIREFLNSRMPDALPTVWKSMLKQVKINTSEGNKSSTIVVSKDYFYLPCAKEIDNSKSSIYDLEGSHIAWFTSNISRVKFRGMIIPDDATYYDDSTDPSCTSSNNIEIGDVWKNGNSIYIYATDEEINYYGLTNIMSAYIGGYWVPSHNWWLRSPNVDDTNYFWYCQPHGLLWYDSGIYSTDFLGVCPCFSI